MPKGLNKVQLIGYLGATPEMRFTAQGVAVITFSIGVGRVWKDAAGAAHDETDWFRIVAWDKLAETCNQFLESGRRVYVEGRLRTRTWEDQQGRPRAATEIVASDVLFLDSHRGEATDGAEAPPPPHASDSAATADAKNADARPAGRTTRPQAAEPGAAARRGRAARTSASSAPPGKRTFDEADLPL